MSPTTGSSSPPVPATDYASEAGVFRFDTVYGLNQTMTEDVSDQYPVHAIFWTRKDGD